MTAQDIEVVIKDFGEEWKKALEDAATAKKPTDTPPLDQIDKGKEKVGSKRKDPQEVPPEAQKTKNGEEETPEAQKRKKSKSTKPALEIALTDDDYDQIATRLKEEMSDTFQAMQTSQNKLQGAIDKQLLELKELSDKAATM